MKLITLNTWGGRVRAPFINFIKNNQDVDIFCFQELYNNATHEFVRIYGDVVKNLFTELQTLLPHHQSFFRPVIDDAYGIGIFIKNEIKILKEGETTIHHAPNYPGHGGAHSRNMQWAKCTHKKNNFTIFNVHGLWNGQGKTDSPERIVQSEKIRTFMDTLDGPKILCGDFNLLPVTKSLAILSTGMTDLIKTHNITSTRTNFYTKKEKFADYVFTSSDIQVKNFQVLPDEVSDHAPLLLEF